ncbi:Hcp1 family type VI secretion system effector [Duganella sp. BJB488]|uniref:Hcp1 family type VI secretion system effector n=1 Tax=Duganella vulcania TaxID=2692166 RepID=A0A845HKD0_9BURK|nr:MULTISPECIES: type VI secretion system tube protein Hcp [Duganella]MYN17985.1 Hcp1 family type VI secretion system effector [Duganella vulcania]NVD73298.1 type VI secretion system tube protein Hcp [Duganella sp. BJB1802]RFP23146.1 Hcp1 family type VI secretion system effector [Duganella sp. BJB489]RFP24780.1 Hcp1 family type VI secretion system effector [Duganella sp. BJB488]RFP34144.1 Hcp1 family type VI secretion system effector [Duganella sp. BJB480]
MSDVLILDLGTTIKGNCMVTGYADKIIVLSYSHSASMPLQMDASNTERTSGRPVFSEISFSKMSDLSTTEMYKACTQGTKIGAAKLHVGRVENGKYMNFFTYEMTNAMISNISTSGGGGVPSDSFSINFTKIKCDYTQQQADSTSKGTGTWNWNLETMKAD